MTDSNYLLFPQKGGGGGEGDGGEGKTHLGYFLVFTVWARGLKGSKLFVCGF